MHRNVPKSFQNPFDQLNAKLFYPVHAIPLSFLTLYYRELAPPLTGLSSIFPAASVSHPALKPSRFHQRRQHHPILHITSNKPWESSLAPALHVC